MDEMLKATNREYPKFCVFENVPGLLSSNKGGDFVACMDMMQDLGFIPDINMLDAQYMGVAQRRKRIYITWINVDYLRNNRTNISDSIMLQLVTELLLLYMGGLFSVVGIPMPKCDAKTLFRYENGIKKRIKLFRLDADKLYSRLAEITDAVDSGMEPLLRDILAINTEDILSQPSDKIQKSIFDCFKTLLSVLTASLEWAKSVSGAGMFANCLEWAEYAIGEIEGYINAGIKYYKGTENMGRDDLLRFYKQKFSEVAGAFERYFREQRGQEILPFCEGLYWHPAPCKGEGQRAAGSAEKGTGAAGEINAVSNMALNDQGGSRIDITESVTATLRSKANHPPCVMEAAGFCTEHSANAGGIGYQEETAPTLREGIVPAAIALESHPQDGRLKIDRSGVIQTITQRAGTGGGNVPLVMNERQYAMTISEDVANTLTETDFKGTQCIIEENKADDNVIKSTFDVRFTSEGTRNARQNVYETDIARTIDTGGNAPDANQGGVAVVETRAFGICSEHSNAMQSDNPNSGIYEAETARTIDTSNQSPAKNQGGMAVVCVDQGGGKSSVNISEELSPTLAGTHGGEPAICIQGSMIGRQDHNGPNGSGINTDVAFTIDSVDRHAVYSMTSGCYQTYAKEMAPPIMARDYKDAAVESVPAYGIGRDAFNQGKNALYNPSVEEELQPTIVAKGPGGVALPQGFYPQMKAGSMCVTDDISPALINGTNPGYQNGVVEPTYTVRRLTPTECAKLQGFPEVWCAGLETEKPTAEDIAFWTEVFETHRKATAPNKKPKTEKQIIKWLKNPYSDSAEYRLWGNAAAIPCILFVLSGIVWAANREGVKTE